MALIAAACLSGLVAVVVSRHCHAPAAGSLLNHGWVRLLLLVAVEPAAAATADLLCSSPVDFCESDQAFLTLWAYGDACRFAQQPPSRVGGSGAGCSSCMMLLLPQRVGMSPASSIVLYFSASYPCHVFTCNMEINSTLRSVVTTRMAMSAAINVVDFWWY